MKHIIIIALLLNLISCKETKSSKADSVHSNQSVHVDSLVITNEIDPICNMSVREHASDTAMINGKVWGFCSPVCKKKYVAAHRLK